LIVMWLGLAIRIWAIAVLGNAFRTTVEVDPGQRVVSTGPYEWVRHPSYTGLLLIVSGFGLAEGNWLALAACMPLVNTGNAPDAAQCRFLWRCEAFHARAVAMPLAFDSVK